VAVSPVLRQEVRARAADRCEYCRKPPGFSAYPHHIEHIIACKHGGTSEIDNLAWACFQCNVAKGSDIASYDPLSGSLTPLFNPRTDDWHEHFELVESEIRGKTAIGRATVRLLQMNQPENLEVRRLLIAAGVW
jgi:hypothetical protein